MNKSVVLISICGLSLVAICYLLAIHLSLLGMSVRTAAKVERLGGRVENSAATALDRERSGNSHEVATPSPEARRVATILQSFSELALAMERGRLRLEVSRTRDSQPDAAMWELRILVHSHPEVLPIVLKYLQDSDSPIAARMFVVFALAQPQSEKVVGLLASVLERPSEVSLANAICVALDTPATRGIGRAWNSMLAHLNSLGVSHQNFEIASDLEYLPDNAEAHAALYRSIGTVVDVNSMLGPIVRLLEERERDLFQSRFMRVAWAMLDLPGAKDTTRERFAEVVNRSYLEMDAGWLPALDILTDARRGWSSESVGVLGRGMQRLDSSRRMSVLNEIACRQPELLYNAPFVEYITEAMEALGRTAKEGGAPEGTYSRLCWSFVVGPPDATWQHQVVLSNPSITFRQRVAGTMEAFVLGGEIAVSDARRVCGVAQAMLRDADSNVRFTAASTLLGLVEKKGALLPQEELRALRARLVEWTQVESVCAHSREEATRLAGIAKRLN